MSELDLKPPTATADVDMVFLTRDRETGTMDSILRGAPAEMQIAMECPDSITQHPISEREAREVCERHVGLGGLRSYKRWTDCLPLWWARLRAATTPEERVSCERMINAISLAAGLHQMERAARLAESNRLRRDQQWAASSAAEKAAKEAAAIDSWR